MSEEVEKIPPAFVAALANGLSVKAAGQAAGLSERTSYRRWARPEVRREVAALRAVFLQQAVSRLASGAVRAAEVVLELLESEDEKIRLTAACRLPELHKSLGEATGKALLEARPPGKQEEQLATYLGGPFQGFQLEHGAG
jgi:hypothetical protein